LKLLVKKGEKMNDSKSDEAAKKVIQPTTDKIDLIILLQKVHNDFIMLDSKMKEILNIDGIDRETLGNVVERLKKINKDLNECAEIRNKKIEEFLKTIKN
jgi:hypothetical protein